MTGGETVAHASVARGQQGQGAAAGSSRLPGGTRARPGTSRGARVRAMWVVYLAENLADAQFLVDRLTSYGIECRLRNEALQGALGELPLTLRPEVCVLDERDVDLARDVVAQHDAAMRAAVPVEERTCSECGELNPNNFELCWKCRHPLD